MKGFKGNTYAPGSECRVRFYRYIAGEGNQGYDDHGINDAVDAGE